LTLREFMASMEDVFDVFPLNLCMCDCGHMSTCAIACGCGCVGVGEGVGHVCTYTCVGFMHVHA
jgi:hypothetical protein